MGLLIFILTYWNTPGQARPGLKWDCFTFTFTSWNPLSYARPVMGMLYLHLNVLEPSGPRQAFNGSAIHLP